MVFNGASTTNSYVHWLNLAQPIIGLDAIQAAQLAVQIVPLARLNCGIAVQCGSLHRGWDASRRVLEGA